MITSNNWVSIVLLLFIFGLVLYLYFTRHFNYWKKRKVPFVPPIAFVGNFFNGLTMRQSMGEIFNDLYYKTTGPYLGLYLLDKPCILIRDPELIKNILITDFNTFDNRNGGNNKSHDPIGGNILFLLKNPEWKCVRTKINPLFTSAKIKYMSKLVEDSGARFVEYLQELTTNDSVAEVKDACQRYTVDLISNTIFGVQSDCFENKTSNILKNSKLIFDWDNLWSSFQMRCCFVLPTFASLFRMKLLSPKPTIYFKALFLSILEARTLSNVKRGDFVDLLLEMESADVDFLKGDILIAQAIQFFAAGFETTSSTMQFALYEIAKNPPIQERLRNEINSVLLKYDGAVTYEALNEMNYLEQCFKETLRKYPILPFLDRSCKHNYKVSGHDLIIEEGIIVFISTLGLHMDPKYYPNPDVYAPERFAKNAESVPFLPFGSGPRHCIGERFAALTTKAGLAHIFKNFGVSVCEQTQNKIEFEKNGLILSALNGIKLNLQKL